MGIAIAAGPSVGVFFDTLIVAMGVCHRDVELAKNWIRWVRFLTNQLGGIELATHKILIVYTARVAVQIGAIKEAARKAPGQRSPFFIFEQCPDEEETGYPRSASHLFLRTLEAAERLAPLADILWCEPDTVPLRPTWFSEWWKEYRQCGKPFMGARVGARLPHLSGNAVYPRDWRTRMPSILTVLTAPDFPGGRGQPWDVWCRDDTTPNMAETKLLHQVWRERTARSTRLEDIPKEACLHHQEKTPQLIFEIARKKYPEFIKSIPNPNKYFLMNGHSNRLWANGFKCYPDAKKFSPSGWTVGFDTSRHSVEEAITLLCLSGKLGLREASQKEFDAIA